MSASGVLTPGSAMWRSVVERNVVSFRRQWAAFVTGFAEPVFYLFSLGIGVGSLVPFVMTDGGRRSPTRPSSRRPCSPARR
uniref:Uncharacterized protein n=1 Tax=Janibacter limosus TaxID=53458 RepID=A0AC61U1W9_9MICO|nr:hypothetical protein [Janibacter limosus]